MTELRRTFRQWWQIPRRVSDRPEERTISFLELFYDLVYVVLIAQIAHSLAGHVDLAGFGQFVFLFVLVWWAWLNGALYHDLHGNNDIRTRVFTGMPARPHIFADVCGGVDGGVCASCHGRRRARLCALLCLLPFHLDDFVVAFWRS